MSKTVSPEQYQQITKFLKDSVEPKIEKMVNELNKHFNKRQVRVGLELTWYIEGLEENEKK